MDRPGIVGPYAKWHTDQKYTQPGMAMAAMSQVNTTIPAHDNPKTRQEGRMLEDCDQPCTCAVTVKAC